MLSKQDTINVALVTGGAGGIGLAIAQKLYALGMRVCVWDTKPISSKSIGTDESRLDTQIIDITDNTHIYKALAAIRERWGGVSVLINNAGISPKNEHEQGYGVCEVSLDEWLHVIAVNLTAPLLLTQACAPDMAKQKWGRIINIASQAARTRSTVPGVAYVSTKTAILGLSRYSAAELGPMGITVNTLAPGRILSEMTSHVPQAITDTFIANTPVRRLGTPEDVAETVAFYIRDETNFLTGTILDINGGLHMP